MISGKDTARLRELAKRQLEYANSERNRRLYDDWKAHGDMNRQSRPMITIEAGTFNDEIITPMLRCESQEARRLEYLLISNTINFEHFKDDMIVRDYIPVDIAYEITPYGLPVERIESGSLGHHFVSRIFDLKEDFHKLSKSIIHKNLDAKRKYGDRIREIIGDILPVKESGACAVACLMQNVVHIMDMQDMFIAMIDEPELFHQMMRMLTDDYIEIYRKMEDDGIILPTNNDVWLSQGSLAFTNDLVDEGEQLKTSDIWVYMDAQETSGVSAEMYHEFVFPYYKEISERFGLLSYGCCESVSNVWENSVSKYENLRKVSISPWCDEEYMGERLQGRKVVYHRKPSPNLIGVERNLDENAARKYIAKTIAASRKAGKLEFSQRDVYTVHGDLRKVERYVQIIRKECEKR